MNSFGEIVSCILCLLTIFVASNEGVRRNLTYSINPGCELPECKPGGKEESYLNVVAVQARGEDSVIHYVWSTYKRPTVVIAQTSHSAVLNINWENLLNFQEAAISFSEAPYHSVAFIINELWEFDDGDDNTNMRKARNITSLGITDFHWNYINDSLSFGDTFISVSPKGQKNESTFSEIGAFEVQFSASAEDTPSKEYPHLWFTSSSTEVKISFVGLGTSYKNSRFAAEIIAISSSKEDTQWNNDTSISFDDEYSPGVFKIERLQYHCPNGQKDCKGFVTWKPVSYIGVVPTVANSSDAAKSQYIVDSAGIADSIATSYFDFRSNISVVAWNMTFGTSGDGFYKKTRYSSWSVMVGVGDPIMDKISTLAIVVIAVGLGAPLVIMLGGGLFLGYKKCVKKDDDLLLDG